MNVIVIAFLFLSLLVFVSFYKNHELSESFTDKFIDKVIYINLDHRSDRRYEIESELDKMGLSYERFPAIKDERGAMGCCKSHLAVLKKAREKGYKTLLVLEDDFKFLMDRPLLEKTIQQLSQVPFDVCLFAYNTNDLHHSDYPFLSKITNAQTTSGYLVKSHYYDTLITQWEYGLKMFQETGNEQKYTCDQSWKTLQEKDTWYCVTERVGIQRDSYSDIQKGHVNPGV